MMYVTWEMLQIIAFNEFKKGFSSVGKMASYVFVNGTDFSFIKC